MDDNQRDVTQDPSTHGCNPKPNDIYGTGRKLEVMDETLSAWIGKHMGPVARIALNLDERPVLYATEIPGFEGLLLGSIRICRD